MTSGTPAAGADMGTVIYRPINGAFPNHVSPPSREQAMNFLSVQLTFRKIFVFVIDKSLSISGWGLVGMRVRGNMKKLDKKKKRDSESSRAQILYLLT